MAPGKIKIVGIKLAEDGAWLRQEQPYYLPPDTSIRFLEEHGDLDDPYSDAYSHHEVEEYWAIIMAGDLKLQIGPDAARKIRNRYANNLEGK